jgi:hypothetical protein
MELQETHKKMAAPYISSISQNPISIVTPRLIIVSSFRKNVKHNITNPKDYDQYAN